MKSLRPTHHGSHYVRDVAFAEDASRIRKNPDIAHVMAAVLDAPMAAYPFVPSFRRDASGGGHPEDIFDADKMTVEKIAKRDEVYK